MIFPRDTPDCSFDELGGRVKRSIANRVGRLGEFIIQDDGIRPLHLIVIISLREGLENYAPTLRVFGRPDCDQT